MSVDVDHELFIIDGKTYDLREWIGKHPGGSVWFSRSNGRDISAAVHAYHKDPAKLKRILQKYEVNVPVHDARDPSLNVPPFILPANFDAHTHTPVYDWNTDRNFLTSLRAKLDTDGTRRRLSRADLLFDIVGVGLLIFHVLMMFIGVYYEILPAVAFVVLFVITRTALASVGHYHCHRKKDGIIDWGDSLFDMQYVGASLVLHDGHVMLHHLYTNSFADPKRTVFTGMLDLPRLWRIPVYTIHRFGQFLTGMFLRWASFSWEAHLDKASWQTIKHVQFFTVRILLVVEFAFCCLTGHAILWFAQFVLCLWWNLFLIVSSHDFEESETKADLAPGQDWGGFQVMNSFDMSVVGNRYIDCFLTAGLGCHRVHHVLPAQKSGFANIISESAVRDTCKEFNIEWHPPKNFVLHRLPRLLKFYMLAPARLLGPRRGITGLLRETFSLVSCKRVVGFLYYGFRGVGSI